MLPKPDPPRPDETRAQYGLRLVRFVLETNCTATLSTDDLELCGHAAVYASTSPYTLPIVYGRLNDLRHEIAKAIVRRAVLDSEPMADPTVQRAVQVPNRTGTSPVPLSPVPRVNPPSGQTVDPRQDSGAEYGPEYDDVVRRYDTVRF